MNRRWWDGSSGAHDALSLVDGDRPEIGIGVVLLGYHGLAAHALRNLPPVADCTTVREVLSGVDLEPVTKAARCAVSGITSAPEAYGEIMARDMHERSSDATVSLLQRMASSGVPWPVAVARAAAVHGVPTERLHTYASLVNAPAVADAVRDDAADRLLHEYASELGRAAVEASSVMSKAARSEEEWDPREHPRGRDGRFVPDSEETGSAPPAEQVERGDSSARRRRRVVGLANQRKAEAAKERAAMKEKERAALAEASAQEAMAANAPAGASTDELAGIAAQSGKRKMRGKGLTGTKLGGQSLAGTKLGGRSLSRNAPEQAPPANDVDDSADTEKQKFIFYDTDWVTGVGVPVGIPIPQGDTEIKARHATQEAAVRPKTMARIHWAIDELRRAQFRQAEGEQEDAVPLYMVRVKGGVIDLVAIEDNGLVVSALEDEVIENKVESVHNGSKTYQALDEGGSEALEDLFEDHGAYMSDPRSDSSHQSVLNMLSFAVPYVGDNKVGVTDETGGVHLADGLYTLKSASPTQSFSFDVNGEYDNMTVAFHTINLLPADAELMEKIQADVETAPEESTSPTGKPVGKAEEWESEEHPRGRDGRFVSLGGGGAAAISAEDASAKRRRRVVGASNERKRRALEEAEEKARVEALLRSDSNNDAVIEELVRGTRERGSLTSERRRLAGRERLSRTGPGRDTNAAGTGPQPGSNPEGVVSPMPSGRAVSTRLPGLILFHDLYDVFSTQELGDKTDHRIPRATIKQAKTIPTDPVNEKLLKFGLEPDGSLTRRSFEHAASYITKIPRYTDLAEASDAARADFVLGSKQMLMKLLTQVATNRSSFEAHRRNVKKDDSVGAMPIPSAQEVPAWLTRTMW